MAEENKTTDVNSDKTDPNNVPATKNDILEALERLGNSAKSAFPVLQSAKLSTSEPDYDDKALFGLSLRGYIAFLLILTVCVLAFMGKTVDETVKNMALVTLGFYFSNKSGK